MTDGRDLPDDGSGDDDVPNQRRPPPIAFDDPFVTPVSERRPDRQLRGRLVAPVTIWTAGERGRRAGLTVSSVLVAEGEPPLVCGLLDPLSELREAIAATGAFVVHVLGEEDRRLAASFAGQYPEDPFASLEVAETPFGPLIAGIRTTAGCALRGTFDAGYHGFVTATIERIDLAGDSAPLAYYRGQYRRLVDGP